MKPLALALSIVLSCIAPVAAPAATTDGRWNALSTTAVGITGDITLSPVRLSLARGVTLPLAFAASAPRFGTDMGTQAVRVFKVVRPTNPVLLNGNRLCSASIRWIVVWRTSDRALGQAPAQNLGMAAFSGTAQPTSESSPGLCGTFSYARARA